ncbi:hypothetical protein M885DRAFT_570852, partial [Pelagophyceae sp. CCMP2097]
MTPTGMTTLRKAVVLLACAFVIESRAVIDDLNGKTAAPTEFYMTDSPNDQQCSAFMDCHGESGAAASITISTDFGFATCTSESRAAEIVEYIAQCTPSKISDCPTKSWLCDDDHYWSVGYCGGVEINAYQGFASTPALRDDPAFVGAVTGAHRLTGAHRRAVDSAAHDGADGSAISCADGSAIVASDVAADELSDVDSDGSAIVASDVAADELSDVDPDGSAVIASDVAADEPSDVDTDGSADGLADGLADGRDVVMDRVLRADGSAISCADNLKLSDVDTDGSSVVASDVAADEPSDVDTDSSAIIASDVAADEPSDVDTDSSAIIASDVAADELSDVTVDPDSSAIIASDVAADKLSDVDPDGSAIIASDVAADDSELSDVDTDGSADGLADSRDVVIGRVLRDGYFQRSAVLDVQGLARGAPRGVVRGGQFHCHLDGFWFRATCTSRAAEIVEYIAQCTLSDSGCPRKSWLCDEDYYWSVGFCYYTIEINAYLNQAVFCDCKNGIVLRPCFQRQNFIAGCDDKSQQLSASLSCADELSDVDTDGSSVVASDVAAVEPSDVDTDSSAIVASDVAADEPSD